MPNHVHVLINPYRPLGKIVQSWKSFAGRFARQHWAELELRDPGENADSFWMEDYWDRYIRHEQHLVAVIDYLHENPVKAGLCDAAELWRWSSANLGTRSSSSANTNSADSMRSWSSAFPEGSSAIADSADSAGSGRTGRSAIPEGKC